MKNLSNQMKFSVILPMAGEGERFKKARFKNYKPFINIDKITMLERCLKSFPDQTDIYIITTNQILENYKTKLNKYNHKIILIEPHKNGPAYSIWLAKNKLPKNHSYFIAYCDIQWSWDFNIVRKYLKYDGIIFTHKGFHPHLVKDNFSAFCKTKNNKSSLLEEIREKSSFTDDWMEEILSIGLFYIKNTLPFFDTIDLMIKNKKKIASEYYPSIIFNEFVKLNFQVYLYEVTSFIHFGIPDHSKDFQRWVTIIKNLGKKNTPFNEHSINYMLMGGSGSRMKEFSREGKGLIPVFGKPMYKFIQMQFSLKKFALITTIDIYKKLNEVENKNNIVLAEQTESQLSTLLNALPEMPDNKSIFLCSCDCYGILNWKKFDLLIADENPDIIIFSFKPSLLSKKLDNQHTHIHHKNNSVLDVYVKNKKKGNNLGLAGFYWFKNKAILNIKSSDISKKNEEKIIDDLIKFQLDSGYKVCHLRLSDYIHIGTPDEFKEFIYWNERGIELMNK